MLHLSTQGKIRRRDHDSGDDTGPADCLTAPSDDRLFAWDSKTKPRFQIAADPYGCLIMLGSSSGTLLLQLPEVHSHCFMAAAEVLLEHLELAGVCCKDFNAPLQKACQHSDAAAVLDWLGRLAGGNLLSDKQALLLQTLDTKAGIQGYDHTQHASTQALITAVQRELESQKLLDAYPSEDEVQQMIANQEATLLQLQSKLKSLQALSSATKKQSMITAQSMAVSGHHERICARRDSNANRLAGQQDACNTLLHDTGKTAALLQAKFEQHSSSWLLALSDMQNVHQQDAKFRTEMDRSEHVSCCMLLQACMLFQSMLLKQLADAMCVIHTVPHILPCLFMLGSAACCPCCTLILPRLSHIHL